MGEDDISLGFKTFNQTEYSHDSVFLIYMSADKRSVSTDALETLGTIIDESAGRDAIHLAVEPCISDEILYPGQQIGIKGNYHYYGTRWKEVF